MHRDPWEPNSDDRERPHDVAIPNQPENRDIELQQSAKTGDTKWEKSKTNGRVIGSVLMVLNLLLKKKNTRVFDLVGLPVA